jgi:RecA-family ATPase
VEVGIMKQDANSIMREHGVDALREVIDGAEIYRLDGSAAGPDRDEPTPHTESPPGADGARDFEAEAAGAQAAPFALITPPQWHGIPIPPMRWLATNRIPAGDVTILSGDGGGGKTTVALQLAVSVARDLGDWLGTTCESGPVIFFSAEEPENEMRRRLDRVVRKRGIEAADIENLHFHFADLDRCLLGTGAPNTPIKPTELFGSLYQRALEIRPSLIIVDSIAATFGGNQNDRVQARMFVNLFRRLALHTECAALLLDHPSLSGMTNGTGRGGSMDWQNATRARLYLRSVENDEGGLGRELEVMKTNYGPPGEKVALRWEDGCYILQGSTPAPQQAAAFRNADQIYLACVELATAQGRNVFAMPGNGYAPKIFAQMPQAKGFTARALAQAQDRLFETGQIENVAFGPPSKNSRRIARKQPAGEAAK